MLPSVATEIPKMGLPVPQMPLPNLFLLSLSTAAWLAALTAAVGLWRIRAVGSRPDSSPTSTSPPSVVPTEPPSALSAAPKRPVSTNHVDDAIGSPRSRFTVRFTLCDEAVEDTGCHVDEEEDRQGEREVSAPLWDREGISFRFRGDLGWYRYQDRAAIDGSVVKLWEDNGGGFTAGFGILRA